MKVDLACSLQRFYSRLHARPACNRPAWAEQINPQISRTSVGPRSRAFMRLPGRQQGARAVRAGGAETAAAVKLFR